MKNDFLKQLHSKGFTARIKRLSDTLIYNAREYYKHSILDIEPNWHLIFLLLKEKKQLTVTEIAFTLGFSHPAIIKIVKKMKEHGYLESIADKNDSRKQQIQLSEKAIKKLPEMEEEWLKIQEVIDEFVDDEFLQKLGEVEEKLAELSFMERCQKRFGNEKS